MMAALFLLMTTTLGLAYSGKRHFGMTLFFITLFGCALLLWHLATSELKINW